MCPGGGAPTAPRRLQVRSRSPEGASWIQPVSVHTFLSTSVIWMQRGVEDELRLNLEVDLLSQLLGLVVLGAGVAVGRQREQSAAHGAAAAFTAEVQGSAREQVGHSELLLQLPVYLPDADAGPR